MIRQVEATHAWMEILAYQTKHMPLDLQPLRLGGNIACEYPSNYSALAYMFSTNTVKCAQYARLRQHKHLNTVHVKPLKSLAVLHTQGVSPRNLFFLHALDINIVLLYSCRRARRED